MTILHQHRAVTKSDRSFSSRAGLIQGIPVKVAGMNRPRTGQVGNRNYHSTFDALPARDRSAALLSTGGDADLADELVVALLDGLAADIEALRVCAFAPDRKGLAELAHRMRGATRYCGVPALDAAVEALERAASVGDGMSVSASFADVEAQALRLMLV
jgi:HPt (histidine-containing phosphotransfer) domain-containing protein